MQYRIVIQFAKPEGSDNWETVAAPIFHTSAAEEDVYAGVRNAIAQLPTDLSDAEQGSQP
jgi:hypothetical protein